MDFALTRLRGLSGGVCFGGLGSGRRMNAVLLVENILKSQYELCWPL